MKDEWMGEITDTLNDWWINECWSSISLFVVIQFLYLIMFLFCFWAILSCCFISLNVLLSLWGLTKSFYGYVDLDYGLPDSFKVISLRLWRFFDLEHHLFGGCLYVFHHFPPSLCILFAIVVIFHLSVSHFKSIVISHKNSGSFRESCAEEID